jgi:inosine/xanthosine triphosphate pyrophosphatase family protein
MPPKQEEVIAEKVFIECKLQYLLTPNMKFENALEKDIFMAINVLRAEPGVYSQVVNEVKKSYPICANAKYTDRLIKFLDMNE